MNWGSNLQPLNQMSSVLTYIWPCQLWCQSFENWYTRGKKCRKKEEKHPRKKEVPKNSNFRCHFVMWVVWPTLNLTFPGIFVSSKSPQINHCNGMHWSGRDNFSTCYGHKKVDLQWFGTRFVIITTSKHTKDEKEYLFPYDNTKQHTHFQGQIC